MFHKNTSPKVGVASPKFPTSQGDSRGDVSPHTLFRETHPLFRETLGMQGDDTLQGGGRVSSKGGLLDIPP